jgi:hypothetical protein
MKAVAVVAEGTIAEGTIAVVPVAVVAVIATEAITTIEPAAPPSTLPGRCAPAGDYRAMAVSATAANVLNFVMGPLLVR